VVAAHSSLERLMNELDDVEAEARYLGFRHVILTSMPQEQRGSAANWKQAAHTLNGIGAELQRRNLQLCYHNHSFEFEEKYDGQYGLDILYANSDPQLVQAELDTYWIKKGGLDPATYIKKYAGRVPLLHIKDRKANGDFAEIGTGLLNWPEIFSAAETNGVQHYIVEQDVCPGNPLDSARLSLNNLRQMGKV
jgi:sugar phosphate isomerase/epimerase